MMDQPSTPGVVHEVHQITFDRMPYYRCNKQILFVNASPRDYLMAKPHITRPTPSPIYRDYSTSMCQILVNNFLP